ncbi:MAG: ankyrin repeat domain-containing protein [Puniceicoccales bacterium]|jgi:ankyrin repeat protein|nr:ankyrin repeat domain-containing protein [Puniceicoccales bacterium]
MKFTKNIIKKLLIGSFLFTGIMGTMTPLQATEEYWKYQNMSDKERTEMLFNSIKEGASIKELLNIVVDINAKDSTGNRPLHCAILQKNLEAIKLLLAQPSIKINAKGQHGNTPLHRAIERNHREVIELLLAHGARVDIENDQGKIALTLANGKNVLPEIQQLVQSQPGRQKRTKTLFELFKTRQPGQEANKLALIEQGVNVNAKDEYGDKLLDWAMYRWSDNVKDANFNIARALIERGAALDNVLNHIYETILNLLLSKAANQSLFNDVYANAEYLIQRGARINRDTYTEISESINKEKSFLRLGSLRNTRYTLMYSPSKTSENEKAVNEFFEFLKDNNAILDD